MVHVSQQPLYGYVADGLLEEQPFDGRLTDGPQVGQHEQQPTEPGGLSRVPAAHVVAQYALGLVLKHFHRLRVDQARRLCV